MKVYLIKLLLLLKGRIELGILAFGKDLSIYYALSRGSTQIFSMLI